MIRLFGFILFACSAATALAGESTYTISCSYQDSNRVQQKLAFTVLAEKASAGSKRGLGLGQLEIHGDAAPIQFVTQSNGIEFKNNVFSSAELVVIGRGGVRIYQSREGNQAWLVSDVQETGLSGRPVPATCVLNLRR